MIHPLAHAPAPGQREHVVGLTLEQQVSQNVTLTYITNLTRTQEQIIRVQVDLNKEWSAIAVREENGVFGIDFQYRKRFK